ncbi:MAG: flagellar basal-body rod protein FlgG [Phycisphaerales bacterium]|nr:flagellar basal-body rod protein FlgG [Phycisphaerae bacterium]NNF43120.1 flagellar basal-body rod protein FlgG [Phycisphaerales bacterium]NNM24914.1 flagellar basal-body rod protein FlgG [Phycisphaerales bacterium]
MAIASLHSASTALNALSTALDVTAHNLANINTDGFKGSRVNFQDLLYEERAQPGVENLNGDQRPIGLYVGHGVRVSGTHLDFSQGPAQVTERPLDVMIEGPGFFQVQVEDDLGGGLAYTRAGNFTLNSDGELVMANDDGRRLDPGVTVPQEATGIAILPDGTVQVDLPGDTEPSEIGNIELASFINPAGLQQVGDNLYIPSAASGPAQLGTPTEGDRGRLTQGFLEGSNVDPVIELVSLIKTQRAFEINSQSIQAADEVLQNVGRLRSF